MPRKTATSKSKTKKVLPETIEQTPAISSEITISQGSSSQSNSLLANLKNYRPSKNVLLITLLIILFALALYKKSWFIAASVNGQPITNFALLSKMNQQYRSQTLDQMISEKVINDEAIKNGIIIKDNDIQTKIAVYEKQVGGKEAFDSLLAQQGQNRADVVNQIRFSLIIEKLFEKEATVSADDIQKFIEQNKDQFTSSDSAVQTKEATDTLKQQKIGQLFRTKFPDLKKAANIKIF